MRTLVLGVWLLLCISCESDVGQRNPYLQETSFRFELNLNLPTYSNLRNIGNPVYVGNAGVGIRGVYVMQTSIDTFFAFEASCPNHSPNDCSTMTLTGTNVTCSCEDYEYSLFTGQLFNRPENERSYDLLFYRAVFTGNSVIISN